VSERLSIVADMNSQRQIAEKTSLKAYLGPQRRDAKVLAGQIRRGSGESIAAVLWSSDLPPLQQMSDRLPGEHLIGILDDLFDLQAKEIVGHGGEILKFVATDCSDLSGRQSRRSRTAPNGNRSRRRKRRWRRSASCVLERHRCPAARSKSFVALTMAPSFTATSERPPPRTSR